MRLGQIIDILEAEVITGGNPDDEILTACGSDMMSDVLAFVKEQGMLLTGLMNPQTVRTADMMDMTCIVFVRGKMPGEDVTSLAAERGVTLLSTRFRMFTACGRLFEAGLGGGSDDL